MGGKTKLSQVLTHLCTPPPAKHPENSLDPSSCCCTHASQLGLPTPLLISSGGAPRAEGADPHRSCAGGCGLGRKGRRQDGACPGLPGPVPAAPTAAGTEGSGGSESDQQTVSTNDKNEGKDVKSKTMTTEREVTTDVDKGSGKPRCLNPRR